MKRAMFQETLENGDIQCILCPKHCVLCERQLGWCRARQVVQGELVSLNYGLVMAMAMDPVEKKPLYHFYPGSYLLSIGTFGCNLDCQFCQNHMLVHSDQEVAYTTPEQLVEMATKSGALGIAFTYNEPTVWYEYVYDVAIIAHDKGLKCVLVTNGMINEAPLRALLPYIDAVNIDLKACDTSFYHTLCFGELLPVLETIKQCALHVHTELTSLLIDNLNSTDKDIVALCHFIEEVSPWIPLHLNKYFPAYRMDLEATNDDVIMAACETAKAFLKYVYIGNVSHVGIDSFCPSCGATLVKRTYRPVSVNMKGSACCQCGEQQYFVL